MTTAYTLDGAVLDPNLPVIVSDVQMSYATMLLLSESERTRYGIRAVDVPDEPEAVPTSVTNYQARAVMRQVPMPDGRSLFTTVDGDLRAAVEATKGLPEFDPDRVRADLTWQAWEQANTYERHGAVTTLLAQRYKLDDARTDDLFRQADKVAA